MKRPFVLLFVFIEVLSRNSTPKEQFEPFILWKGGC
jgi:hypothetical protein